MSILEINKSLEIVKYHFLLMGREFQENDLSVDFFDKTVLLVLIHSIVLSQKEKSVDKIKAEIHKEVDNAIALFLKNMGVCDVYGEQENDAN